MLCSASRVAAGEIICIYMRSAVKKSCSLHGWSAGMDQKVRFLEVWIGIILGWQSVVC